MAGNTVNPGFIRAVCKSSAGRTCNENIRHNVVRDIATAALQIAPTAWYLNTASEMVKEKNTAPINAQNNICKSSFLVIKVLINT
jgi:hypothetical protein